MKRLTIPIILLFIIVIGLGAGIYLTTLKSPNSALNNTALDTSKYLTLYSMRLSFTPNIIRLTGSETNVEADIVLDVGSESIASTDIEVTCDPKRIKNLKLTQKRDRYSALSYSFADTKAVTDVKTCESTLKLQIPEGTPEQRGSGVVVHISATVTGDTPTEIVINPRSSGKTNQPGKGFDVTRVNLELTK